MLLQFLNNFLFLHYKLFFISSVFKGVEEETDSINSGNCIFPCLYLTRSSWIFNSGDSSVWKSVFNCFFKFSPNKTESLTNWFSVFNKLSSISLTNLPCDQMSYRHYHFLELKLERLNFTDIHLKHFLKRFYYRPNKYSKQLKLEMILML